MTQNGSEISLYFQTVIFTLHLWLSEELRTNRKALKDLRFKKHSRRYVIDEGRKENAMMKHFLIKMIPISLRFEKLRRLAFNCPSIYRGRYTCNQQLLLYIYWKWFVNFSILPLKNQFEINKNWPEYLSGITTWRTKREQFIIWATINSL